MLDFTKQILTKVSFDPELFRKELGKSVNILNPAEIKKLRYWCLFTFGAVYCDIILEVFGNRI